MKESTGCRLPQWQEAVFQNAFKLGITYGLAADLKMLLTARRSETALISGPVLYHSPWIHSSILSMIFRALGWTGECHMCSNK